MKLSNMKDKVYFEQFKPHSQTINRDTVDSYLHSHNEKSRKVKLSYKATGQTHNSYSGWGGAGGRMGWGG